MMRRRLAALLLAGSLATTACGTSGSGPSRPVETLIYVTGGPNLQFQFAQTPDPACGSVGTGIQAPNASHQFGDRVFVAPHLFVLENVRQPVRSVIRNLGGPGNPDLVVDTFLGTIPQNSNVRIPPGTCGTVITSGAPNNLHVQPRGPEVQIDICAPLDSSGALDLSMLCAGNPVDAPDLSLGFFASLGDIRSTNITSCVLAGLLDSCRTSATFFIEQPQDRVDVVMQVNPGQNPSGGNPARIRVDLSVDGNRVDSDTGDNPIVSHEF